RADSRVSAAIRLLGTAFDGLQDLGDPIPSHGNAGGPTGDVEPAGGAAHLDVDQRVFALRLFRLVGGDGGEQGRHHLDDQQRLARHDHGGLPVAVDDDGVLVWY